MQPLREDGSSNDFRSTEVNNLLDDIYVKLREPVQSIYSLVQVDDRAPSEQDDDCYHDAKDRQPVDRRTQLIQGQTFQFQLAFRLIEPVADPGECAFDFRADPVPVLVVSPLALLHS